MRISKTREKIIRLLSKNQKPTDAVYLTQKIKVNKTTIYRDLENLLKENLITEIDFGDGKKRYEINSQKHHHHIVCKNCGKIEDLKSEKLESEINNLINKTKNFMVLNHSLEFFGKCENCITK
jgi:Fe2+ or Zn2+ uptake regulation protein